MNLTDASLELVVAEEKRRVIEELKKEPNDGDPLSEALGRLLKSRADAIEEVLRGTQLGKQILEYFRRLFQWQLERLPE